MLYNNSPINNNNAAQGDIVISPRENDVLCQRGKAAFSHEGNSYFRKIIEAEMHHYEAAPDRIEKSLIVADIVQHILNRGGRFLKRSTNQERWTLASTREAKDKVSYALRRSAKDEKYEGNECFRRNCAQTNLESLAMACFAQPVVVNLCEFDKSKQETEVVLQSVMESSCNDSMHSEAMDNEDTCDFDLPSFNSVKDEEAEMSLEELFDEKFDRSFGDLVDSYNNMSLQDFNHE